MVTRWYGSYIIKLGETSRCNFDQCESSRLHCWPLHVSRKARSYINHNDIWSDPLDGYWQGIIFTIHTLSNSLVSMLRLTGVCWYKKVTRYKDHNTWFSHKGTELINSNHGTDSQCVHDCKSIQCQIAVLHYSIIMCTCLLANVGQLTIQNDARCLCNACTWSMV